MILEMRTRTRVEVAVIAGMVFLSSLISVCPCAPEKTGSGHACCAPALSLSAADGTCCPPSLTLESVDGVSFAATGPTEAPGLAASAALPAGGVSALAVAPSFAPSPPSVLRI